MSFFIVCNTFFEGEGFALTHSLMKQSVMVVKAFMRVNVRWGSHQQAETVLGTHPILSVPSLFTQISAHVMEKRELKCCCIKGLHSTKAGKRRLGNNKN